jgi:type IV secretory pathway TraG/TraD family ATPase VirD4
LLARALLSKTDTQQDKTFFLLDEIATLQQMSSIVKLLNLGRSKGCCTYLGVQNYTQLDRIYSKEIRRSIINSCGSCVVFAVNDTETASDSSKLIGDVENLKADKSLSMGLTDHKGGTSLSYHSKTEPLLLPSEIMNFPELTGVVRFANYPPVITKLKYKEYDIIAEPLLIRDDLILK